MIRYQDSLAGITDEMLGGFFAGWRQPRTPHEHMMILAGSDVVTLAVDTETNRVVGFSNALTDGLQSAFVPLLEVLPTYRGRGIGSELVRKMLDRLSHLPCVDLTCDPETQPFYRRFGMVPSVGMIIRRP
jgi:ribosomal protein S18 acetylase RimI-like enzyme